MRYCIIQDCRKLHEAKNYCHSHYMQSWRSTKIKPLKNKSELPRIRNIAGSRSTEYHSWNLMKFRCYNPSYKTFHRYGGRGIEVCERWRGKDGFTNFINDMGEKPTLKHTIDRINSNGNYEPSNCKWSTNLEQQQNKCNSKNI